MGDLERVKMDKNVSNVSEQLKKYSIYIVDVDKELPKDLNYEFVILNRDMIIGKEEDFVNNKIEYFPARLFVVGNKSKITDGWLKRRICVLSQEEFNQQYPEIKSNGKIDDAKTEKKTEKFKLWLYQKWIEHLKEIRNINNRPLDCYVCLEGQETSNLEPILKFIYENYKEEIEKFIKETENLNSFPTFNNTPENSIDFSSIEDFTYCIVRNALGQCKNNKNLLRNVQLFIECLRNTLTKNVVSTIPTSLNISKSPDVFNVFNVFTLSVDDKFATIRNEDPGSNDKNAIVYLKHGSAKNRKNLYFEGLSGSQSYFSLFISNLNDYQKKKFFCQLIENALLRYVIVDERVADYRVKNSDFAERAKAGGIQIPLKIKKYNSNGNEYLTLASGNPADDSPQDYENCKGDVLIIHQGVLDEICSDEVKPEKFVNDQMKKFPFVFITTGRGREGTIKGIKYIPFSNISHYLLKAFPEKFVLTTILMQITVPQTRGKDE